MINYKDIYGIRKLELLCILKPMELDYVLKRNYALMMLKEGRPQKTIREITKLSKRQITRISLEGQKLGILPKTDRYKLFRELL